MGRLCRLPALDRYQDGSPAVEFACRWMDAGHGFCPRSPAANRALGFLPLREGLQVACRSIALDMNWRASMPEDYAAQLPCCADRVRAGFDPGRAALPRPSATDTMTELPLSPIGYTFGQTPTNQRAGRGASERLRAEVRNAPRGAMPGIACLNKSVLRPIGESERGLTTCR